MKFLNVLNEESKKLKSIKNDVSLVSIDNTKAIRKIYNDESSMNTEILNLKMLSEKGVPVPNVLTLKDNVAYIQRVEGVTYVDIIDRIEQGKLSPKNIDKVSRELCEWLKLFYYATEGKSRGDVNLRNFIFTTMGKCVSVDFEEEFTDEKMEYDMGNILAYAATYELELTQGKLMLCKSLYKHFLEMGAEPNELHNDYLRQIISFQDRRKGFIKIKDNAIKYFDLIKMAT